VSAEPNKRPLEKIVAGLEQEENWASPDEIPPHADADVPELVRLETPEFDASTLGTRVDESNLNRPEEGSLTLPFTSLSSVLEEHAEEDQEWTWRGFIAGGVITLLGGWPKVGKTTLLFALLAAIRAGVPFLGLETSKTGILLLTEERKRTLRPKLRLWHLVGEVHHLRLDQVPAYMPWPEVARQAVAYCRSNGLGLLVVDTFPKWARIEDENAPGLVLSAVKPLDDAAAAGLGVLALAHQRKARGRFGEAVRGSNALVGAVDVVVELERLLSLRDPHARVLHAVSRFDETPESLVVALGETAYEVRGDVAEAQAVEDQERVLEAIVSAGQLNGDEIAEATEFPKARAMRHAKALFEAGRIGRTGAGKKGNPHVFHAEIFDSSTRDLLVDESNLELFEEPS